MKKMFLLFVITTLFIMNSVYSHAITLEDPDTPTSFNVEILPWTMVNHIIPNRSIFTITDVETGLQFTVQRRAGSKHADVQPLTYKDTKIMKKIYNGKWSWKRRAILVGTNDQLLAASMHGMPHGAGALKNGFPGHFCVHFLGSTTHGSRHEDLSHKLMILRAGGRLDAYLKAISPSQLINVFEAAVNQGDHKIIKMIVKKGKKQKTLQEKLQRITVIRFDEKTLSVDEGKDDIISQQINVKATVYKSDNRQERKTLQFMFWKDIGTGQWKIDDKIAEELN
ncbi:hypothetical protein [Niallia endozanthoxylica]|uniref:hypothetical protein n=1 Tax=Niallia endozanthoxylica TaxID=2036016 RepID=UPI00168C0184|nr:hypothetical protein [Niallia endozanthoxylica]